MEPFYGQVCTFAFNFAPEGWLPCDGSTFKIPQYEPLFALIGTQFGGDGVNTFQVPKLPDLAPGIGYFISTTGIFPARP